MGYAESEKETPTAVTEARSKAITVYVDPANLNEAFIKFKDCVLFYLAVISRKFVAIGDVGININKVVPDVFWNSVNEKVINYNLSGRFGGGEGAGDTW